MLANVILVIIWLGLTAYAVFGGADFGAGVWDLLAGGPEKGGRVRWMIERVIGPVWEANHVWLIFVLVYLWTAFPEAFAAIASTMYIPLSLAGLGIVGRGAGFAFRKWAATTGKAEVMGIVFAGASLATPFFLGTVAGGVASGRVPLGNAAGDRWTSWLNPTSVLGGVLAVLACSYLAAVLLTRDATAAGERDLADYFRTRALATGVVAGIIAGAGIGILAADAPPLFEGLTSGLGVATMAVSALGGVASLYLLWRRDFVLARPAAIVAVVAVLWGWGVAHYPDILPGLLDVEDAAASPPVLWALVGAFAAAAIIALPALSYLLTLAQHGRLGESGDILGDSTEALLGRLDRSQSADRSPRAR